ncbi:hypothetical protein ACFLSZ_06260, partial [Candidatus Bipolaricaulota bacterium]
ILCRLLEAQAPEDFVGLPDSPSVSVDGGPDRGISCADPSTTLTATVTGGVAPIRYEWIGPSGQSLGDSPSIVASVPGGYTVVVVSCGGCMAADTVTVHGDFTTPSVQASVSGVLTGYATTVDLTATVWEGTPPFDLEWSGPSGERLNQGAVLSVSEPGTYAVTAIGANGCSASASIVVTQDIEPPNVSIEITPMPALAAAIEGADAVLNCALPQVLLTGVISGGREPYTMAWTDSAEATLGDTLSLAVDTSDSYCLTVTGANGSSASTWAIVVEDVDPPTVSASASNTLNCAVTEVTLSSEVSGGRQPYALEWTNEAGIVLGDKATLAVTEPGLYTITGIGANGCSAEARIAVTQDIEAPIVSASVSGSLTCATNEVTLTATASEGREPYEYLWTNSTGVIIGDNAAISVANPGTYRVVATGSNGCQAETEVNVLQDTEPPTVEATVDGVLTCALTEVNVHANISGGRSPVSVEWVNAAGQVVGHDALLKVSTSDVYTVRVTGYNGCSARDQVTVTEDIAVPSVSAQADGMLTCAVTEVRLTPTVQGGRAPFQYTWTNAAGQLMSELATLTVSNPGTYTVTVIGANGCSAAADVTVLQDIEAPNVTGSVSGELTCAVTEVILTAAISGDRLPYAYRWTDEAGRVVGDQAEVAVNEPGLYTITVAGANGCTGSASQIVEQDIAPPSVAVGADRILTCSEPEVFVDAIVCGGRGPFEFEWTDECGAVIGTTEDIALYLAGTYTLTVTGANGCISSDSLVVVSGIDPPIVDAGPDQVLACVGDEVTLHASVTSGACPYDYAWVDSCGEIVGTCEDLVVSVPGIYIVTVQSADGCIGVDSVTVSSP